MTQFADVKIPDSKLAREATELVRDCESDLLFHHSVRVYLWGSLRGRHRGWRFDPELVYLGAMFHDVGLTEKHRTATDRFELDSANAAGRFLRSHGVPEGSVELVWDAIALHTTPEIPWHKKPEVALVTAGVELDVLGFGFDEVTAEVKAQVLAAHPRRNFKTEIVEAFAEGFRHKPDSTFGTVNADVLEKLVPGFRRQNFCEIIADSRFAE
ncbi:MAG TPA: HD domain-containing protein [Pirellulales bacterium]|jgi:hypothetical protein|nr:HD domain-containing protein [Pirellulales bacterium]